MGVGPRLYVPLLPTNLLPEELLVRHPDRDMPLYQLPLPVFSVEDAGQPSWYLRAVLKRPSRATRYPADRPLDERLYLSWGELEGAVLHLLPGLLGHPLTSLGPLLRIGADHEHPLVRRGVAVDPGEILARGGL